MAIMFRYLFFFLKKDPAFLLIRNNSFLFKIYALLENFENIQVGAVLMIERTVIVLKFMHPWKTLEMINTFILIQLISQNKSKEKVKVHG